MSSKKRGFSISSKILLSYTLALLAVLPIFVFLLVSSRALVQGSVGESTSELAREIMTLIEADIASQIEVLSLDGISQVSQDALVASAEAWEELSVDERNAIIDERDVLWRLGSGEELEETILNGDYSKQLVRNFIDFYTESSGFRLYEEVLVADRYGALVAATQRTSDYRQDDEEWWQVAKAEGIHVGQIDFDESAQAFTLPISVAVYDENDSFIGVYKAGFSVEEVVQEVATVSRDLSISRIQLVDGRNRLVYSTEAYTFLEDLSGSPFLAPGAFLPDRDYGRIRVDGVLTIFALARSDGYRLFQGTDWTLLVQNDVSTQSSAFRQSILNERYAIALSTVLMSIGLLIVYFTSRSVSKPIGDVTELVKDYAGGKLDATIPKPLLKRSDEFGSLSRAFETMRASLHELTTELERKVQERTEELEKSSVQVEARAKELDKLNKLMVGRELKMVELKKQLSKTGPVPVVPKKRVVKKRSSVKKPRK